MNTEEIRKALDTATPGPWTIVNGRIFGKSTTAIDPLIHEFQTDSQRDVRNAHLIANAPTWLRSLLEENEQLRNFSKSVIQAGFEARELDGMDIQELGVKHGLLIEEPYNTEKHGEDSCADPGDPYYVYTAILSKEAKAYET